MNRPGARIPPTEVQAPPAALACGTRVGDYVLGPPLARGGSSTVYCAMHPLIGKRAAVKVLDPRNEDARGAAERLLREARAVNRIGHPSVVDVFACGQLEDGRSYLIMELLEGETLAERMRHFRLSNEEIYEILIQLSDVLDRAHTLDIAHLDLKPENVFLVPVHGGRTLVKLLDFGLASQHKHSDAPPVGHSFRGTPEYASPEQAQARATIDRRSDIYSMGIVAFELFTGARPFAAPTVRELLRKQIHEESLRPSVLCAAIPPPVETLVLDMLQKGPQWRPTAAEVRERLLTIRLASLRCSTLTMPAVAARRRWRNQAAAAAVLTITLCALAWRYSSRPTGSATADELAAPAASSASGNLSNLGGQGTSHGSAGAGSQRLARPELP